MESVVEYVTRSAPSTALAPTRAIVGNARKTGRRTSSHTRGIHSWQTAMCIVSVVLSNRWCIALRPFSELLLLGEAAECILPFEICNGFDHASSFASPLCATPKSQCVTVMFASPLCATPKSQRVTVTFASPPCATPKPQCVTVTFASPLCATPKSRCVTVTFASPLCATPKSQCVTVTFASPLCATPKSQCVTVTFAAPLCATPKPQCVTNVCRPALCDTKIAVCDGCVCESPFFFVVLKIFWLILSFFCCFLFEKDCRDGVNDIATPLEWDNE
jgi:hypothetical protein